jgi:hypothetical protein
MDDMVTPFQWLKIECTHLQGGANNPNDKEAPNPF